MYLSKIREDAAKIERIIEQYNRSIERQRWMHEHDETLMGGYRPRCDPLLAEKRGVERMVVAYIRCAGRNYNLPETIIESLCQVSCKYIQHAYEQEEPETFGSGTKWFKEARKDIMENFLYQEFKEQLDSPNPIRTFSFYATFVSTKAVINLLTEHTEGIETLQSIHPEHLPMPTRENALAFKSSEWYDETDPIWYLSCVYISVPGVWEAAQTLQLHYGELARFYRTEEDESQLPDYLFEVGMEVTEDTLIEVAVQAYLAEEGSADDIAGEYGIGQKRFRKELRNRGIMISHGGDRKKGS